MEIGAEILPEVKREILLTQCVEKGWKLFVYQFGKIKDTKAGYLQNELNRRTPFLKRYTSSWEDKLVFDAKRWRQEEPRLKNETEARVAVMTSDGAYFQVAKAVDENGDVSQGYVRTMEAFRALMPWNKTGSNPIVIDQVTTADLEQAEDYINSKLPKQK